MGSIMINGVEFPTVRIDELPPLTSPSLGGAHTPAMVDGEGGRFAMAELVAYLTGSGGLATETDVETAIAAMKGGASSGFDTLGEIEAALGLRLRIDAAQGLTLAQKRRGLINLGAQATSIVSASANLTVTTDHLGAVIDIDASAAARTVDLLLTATASVGFVVTIRKSDTSFNAVTIDGAGSETINGATTFLLRLPRQSVTLMCDGTTWRVIGESGRVFVDSNANGNYVRFSDGTQYCYADGTALAPSTAEGSIYRSGSTSWTFPVTFTQVPIGVATPSGTLRWAAAPTTTSTMSYRVFAGVSDAATGAVRLFAYGVWF